MPKKYSLDTYRRQAHKLPFVLEVDDERALEIPAPSTDAVLRMSDTDSAREQLQLLAGDQYDALMEVLGDEQGGVLQALLNDMTQHFGMGESRASRT